VEELKGKRVLFIGPKFYNYHQEIKNKLICQDLHVDFFIERPNNLLYRFFKNYNQLVSNYLEKKYLDTILKKINTNYDYFFLIRGEIISKDFLEALKLKIPKAKFVMYQWDSSENNPNYLEIMSMFNKVMTFDMVDAKRLNIQYLPLFYIDSYETLILNDKREYDIVFFASLHGDRLEILKKVIKFCDENHLKFYFHLYIPMLALIKALLYRKIKISDVKYLSTNTIEHTDILDFYKKSKSVLDLESSSQQGLTIRTFEVLGSGVKLITTNKNILNERFYNQKNIYYLDKRNISLDMDFFKHSEKLEMEKYSLTQWVKTILL
jgi:hypothetical protein